MANLTTSVSRSMYLRMINDLRRAWKKRLCNNSKIISRHLTGGSEEKTKNLQGRRSRGQNLNPLSPVY
jgi:hypothetical protein